MSEDMPNLGRRLADRVARWFEVVLLALISALLGIVVYFYGGLPKQISDLAAVIGELQLELRFMKDDIKDLKETARVGQDWRDRQIILEQKQNRLADEVQLVEKRVDKLEAPFWKKGK